MQLVVQLASQQNCETSCTENCIVQQTPPLTLTQIQVVAIDISVEKCGKIVTFLFQGNTAQASEILHILEKFEFVFQLLQTSESVTHIHDQAIKHSVLS